MDDRPVIAKLWWVIPSGFILVLAIVVSFGGVQPPQKPAASSSLDASDAGVRAAFLLLQRLDFSVSPSRKLLGGQVRWLLFPSAENEIVLDANDDGPVVPSKRRGRSIHEEVRELDEWVRAGGVLLLADATGEFARLLGLRLRPGKNRAETVTIKPDGSRPLQIDGGPHSFDVEMPPPRTWPEEGRPLVLIFSWGKGAIWLVNQPDIFRNDRIGSGDNALAIVMLAEATSAQGKRRIEFDEYFHGMREHVGPLDLLFRPPVLWVTLQALLALLLVLWRALPRFGPLRELPPVRRRSKEEFLKALAYLLGRKRAYVEACEVMRQALRHDLEDALHLSGRISPSLIAEQASRRKPVIDKRRLEDALTRRPEALTRDEFLVEVNELDQLRHEFFS